MNKLFIIIVTLLTVPAFAGYPSPEGAVKYLYKAAAKSDLKKASKVLTDQAAEKYGNASALQMLNEEAVAAEKLKMESALIERDGDTAWYLVQALKKSNKDLVRTFQASCEEREHLQCWGGPNLHDCWMVTTRDCEIYK